MRFKKPLCNMLASGVNLTIADFDVGMSESRLIKREHLHPYMKTIRTWKTAASACHYYT